MAADAAGAPLAKVMEQARRHKDVGAINVRFWHLADVASAGLHVRSQQ